MLKHMLTLLLVAITFGATIPSVKANELDRIKERGKLIVGVKADYQPYGYRDANGNIIGIEPDLAQDVADKLGVELELVPVTSSNRIQLLQKGKIDLMIATLTDREDRRKVINIIEPHYYSSGTNILASKKADIKTWEDLKGQLVCGIQGSFYNRKIAREFGARIVAFKSTTEACAALKAGQCNAFVYDDSAIIGQLQDKAQWKDFEMPLKTIDNAPWGLAVALNQKDIYRFVSDTIKKWHGTGYILELETKWGIRNTPFAIMMHEKYKSEND